MSFSVLVSSQGIGPIEGLQVGMVVLFLVF